MKQTKPSEILYLILLAIILLTSGCQPTGSGEVKEDPVRIAISKAVPEESYQYYPKWIAFGDSAAICYDMYHLTIDSALMLLESCDGILFTGGTDIFPGRYGKEADTARCWEPDFKRDSLESLLFSKARELGMPIMGICRGLQMINVETGGTLYIDLPTDLDTLVTHMAGDSYIASHHIRTGKNSMLRLISGADSGIVNSAHHQGIELLGNQLVAQATSEDGLIESIALADTMQYLLGVQWHPERMDYSDPLSGNLAKRFLKEANRYKANKSHE